VRINLKVARKLLLLLLARQSRLWDDALARASGSGSPKSKVGFGKGWPANPGRAASRCQIASLVTLTTPRPARHRGKALSSGRGRRRFAR
jgi:hypothetical protein